MSAETPKTGLKRCPICKSVALAPYLPFCSKRCADVDLGKWFTNAYAIPGTGHDDEAENVGNAAGDDDDETQQ